MTAKKKQPPEPKPKKFATKCLMLKTPDKRCFFTEEKNFPMLVEFGRTFDAEISVIQLKKEVEVLELNDLAKSLCTPEAEIKTFEYDILETKLAIPTKQIVEDRTTKIKKAQEITAHIQAEMKAGKTVELSFLETKFTDVQKSSLNSYFTRARRELMAKGYAVKRQSPGAWRIAQEFKKDYNE